MLYLIVILQVCSLSPSPREPFLMPTSLGQGVVLDHRVFLLSQMCFIFNLKLKTL
jgi:hypothetical protein